MGLQFRELLWRGNVIFLRGLVNCDTLDGITVDHVVLVQQLLGESLLRQKDVPVCSFEPIDAEERQRRLYRENALWPKLPQ